MEGTEKYALPRRVTEGALMFTNNSSRLTSMMIYGGTLLLSILSFATTFLGMKILLSFPLALAGLLGLQVAIFGIA